MSTESGTETTSADVPALTDQRSSLRRQLPALLALGGVALLLIGVAIGLVINSGNGSGSDRPAADSVAVGFAQDMSTHHSQGVRMATAAMNYTTDPQVKSLAYDILTQQTNQIGRMQDWLIQWGYPLDNPNTAMSWMSGADSHHSDSMDSMAGMDGMTADHMVAGDGVTTPLMPGMATSSEMTRLESLRGSAGDMYFLQLMLRHHEGGLEMMAYADDEKNVSESYVRNLAHQMSTNQTAEIEALKAMIAERGGTPLAMN